MAAYIPAYIPATNSAAYITNRKITPVGIVVHSTGANNPNLKRYVGPDDGKIGDNPNKNYFNSKVSEVCPHAVIGKLKDGTTATYQILPWDIACFCSGSGNSQLATTNGFSGNNANFLGYIQFEIAEDGLTDKIYCTSVYNEALNLCKYLVTKYNIKITNKTIVDHNEARLLGIASAHYDVSHWWPKLGYTMDQFRSDLTKAISGTTTTTPTTTTPTTTDVKGDLKMENKVSSDNYNVRINPDSASTKIASLKPGDKYTLLSGIAAVADKTGNKYKAIRIGNFLGWAIVTE
jgi:hypothetical protein